MRTFAARARVSARFLVVAARWLLGCSSIGSAVFGCSSATFASEANVAPRGDPIEYSFGTVEGEVIGSALHRGRVTVLLFVTTFDLASQAQAKRLEDLVRTHAPRLNALGVVLEPPRYADLARTFAEVTEIHYPIAMADVGTLSGQGPFGAVNAVPTWVVLDREGRVRAVFHGPLAPTEIEDLVRRAE